MTQKKLEIIGPYTPEHEGPFCLGDGRPVRLLTREEGTTTFPIVGYIDDADLPAAWSLHGYCVHRHTRDVHDNTHDLMNAHEVPVAQEIWVNEYTTDVKRFTHSSLEKAESNLRRDGTFIRTIHFREVLPGEGA